MTTSAPHRTLLALGFSSILLAMPLACAPSDPQAPPPMSDEDFKRMAEVMPIPVPENPDAKAVDLVEKDALAEFRFAYPREAAAITSLKGLLDAQLADARATIHQTAESERDVRAEMDAPFNGLFSSTRYVLAGKSERLLSLLGETEVYTGGAHPLGGTKAMVWDRLLDKPVDTAVLFGTADGRDAALRADFCPLLKAARQKRVGTVPDGEMFEKCPDLDAVTILPVDQDGDGLFETIAMIADPYVAGSYAEGGYRLDVPVNPKRRAMIAEDYRAAFGQ